MALRECTSAPDAGNDQHEPVARPWLWAPRIRRLSQRDQRLGQLLATMLEVAVRGLPSMFLPRERSFAFTVRRQVSGEVRPEGESLRYSAIVTLGAALLPESYQRPIFGGAARSLPLGMSIWPEGNFARFWKPIRQTRRRIVVWAKSTGGRARWMMP